MITSFSTIFSTSTGTSLMTSFSTIFSTGTSTIFSTIFSTGTSTIFSMTFGPGSTCDETTCDSGSGCGAGSGCGSGSGCGAGSGSGCGSGSALGAGASNGSRDSTIVAVGGSRPLAISASAAARLKGPRGLPSPISIEKRMSRNGTSSTRRHTSLSSDISCPG